MSVSRTKPLLIFDGDCGFCRYWVDYWQALTGSAVEYAPYQEVGTEFPAISTADFARSIYLISPDGSISKGAEASFRTVAYAPGWRPWLGCYRYLPGFAATTEALYRFIASHRTAFAQLSRLLFGPSLRPPSYSLVTDYLLRGLALIYLVAIVSFWSQAIGLIGSDGIMPLSDLQAAASLDPSYSRYASLPSLFWLSSSDAFIRLVCGSGALIALAAAASIQQRLAFVLLFIIYLSLVHAGQVFMMYQWDYLLLEAGFLAIFLRAAPTPFIWLYRWLVFRFMWEAGLVKLATGDVAWLSLTALDYHFFTQPLPTPLAWYAQQLPEMVKQGLTAAVLAIELYVPFLIFMPRRLRFFAAWCFIALQLAIMLTGNYGFFNVLTTLLCLSLFDDARLGNLNEEVHKKLAVETWPKSYPATFVAVSVAVLSTALLSQRWLGPNWLSPSLARLAPFHVVNNYGPFGVMTRTRHELSIEGSNDGKNWLVYRFKYKPEDPNEAPCWCIPHQPRLDWQMWFAALDDEQPVWFRHFLRKLRQHAAPVSGLLPEDPFPSQGPRYLRVTTYDYQFSRSGSAWWQRTLVASE